MIYERIYRKLERLDVIALIETRPTPRKAPHPVSWTRASTGFTRRRQGSLSPLLTTLCCDPDMQIRVYPERRIAEALTFQQAIPPVLNKCWSSPIAMSPGARALER